MSRDYRSDGREAANQRQGYEGCESRHRDQHAGDQRRHEPDRETGEDAQEAGEDRPVNRRRVAAETDRGLVRPRNEDSHLASPPLVVVADGVGGANAGDVASALAVEVFAEWKPKILARGGQSLRGR